MIISQTLLIIVSPLYYRVSTIRCSNMSKSVVKQCLCSSWLRPNGGWLIERDVERGVFDGIIAWTEGHYTSHCLGREERRTWWIRADCVNRKVSGRQTSRQADERTSRQAGKQADRQTDIHTDRQTPVWAICSQSVEYQVTEEKYRTDGYWMDKSQNNDNVLVLPEIENNVNVLVLPEIENNVIVAENCLMRSALMKKKTLPGSGV